MAPSERLKDHGDVCFLYGSDRDERQAHEEVSCNLHSDDYAAKWTVALSL